MNQWKKWLAMAGVAAVCLTANSVLAQNNGGGGNGGNGGGGRTRGGRNGGNFDPAARRQQQLDRYKEALEITDNAEWNVIQPAISKVMDAQQEERAATFGGGRGRGGRGGNNQNTNGGNGGNNNGGGPGGGFGGFGGTPNPDVEALQAALDAKASTEEIKAKLAKLRDSVKAKEDKLAAARADLQKLLSTRQEATAVLEGLLR